MNLRFIAALLVTGVLVGVFFPSRLTAAFGPATLYAFLPALIFEAAWRLDLQLMKKNWKPIVLLAVPGVAITAGIIAACTHYLGGLMWGPALLLGAILSATDPIAVIAIFRRLRVPNSLATIIEAEALLNDAIAVVLYRTVLAVLVVAGGASRIAPEMLNASEGVAVGIAIGIVLAYAAAFALRDAVTGALQTVATLVGAYGSYGIASAFGWSGIFAVIAFGITLRELERCRISVASARTVAHFWDRASMFANLLLFFMIGAALDLTRLRYTLVLDATAVGGVVIARVVVAYGLLRLVRMHLQPFWMTVVRMAGIRGALSLALALATPGLVAQRGELINAVFTVVVATILVGTLTLRPRLERMPLRGDSSGR